MADELKEVLYGRTKRISVADGNIYILREPSIDTLETLDFDMKNVDEIKNIKKLLWILLKEDNPSLSEKSFGKLITMSMMTDGSELMNAVSYVLGRDSKKDEARG